MSIWDSAYAKAAINKYFKEAIDQLKALAGIEGELDLSNKLDKPAAGTFINGNFATYNPATGNIEDSGKNDSTYVKDPDYVHTDNNFTTAYKNVLDTLPADINAGAKIPLLQPGAGETGNLTTVAANGTLNISDVKATGVARDYLFDLGTTGGSFATVLNVVETIPQYVSAMIMYTLSLSSDATKKRSGVLLAIFDGANEPVYTHLGSLNMGADFLGDLTLGIDVDSKIAFTYNRVEDTADYADTLQIKMLLQ
jgi:hypothetical protein